jgi:23S rRNA m(5)U-1939 methyltransferase (EC 2.1.1.-)
VDVLAPGSGGARLIVGTQTPSVVRERVGDREFRVDDSGFWQVHEGAARALTDAVQDAIDPTLFDPRAANLDLYGGVGLLAAAVGDRFGRTVRITTVESDVRATEHAAENLAEWVGAIAVTGRVEHWVRSLADASAGERARLAAATVVLDPPRAGAGRAVLEALAAVRPAQLVYVACDPIAFAAMSAPLPVSATAWPGCARSICSPTPIMSRRSGASSATDKRRARSPVAVSGGDSTPHWADSAPRPPGARADSATRIRRTRCESIRVPGELTRYDGARAFRRPHSWGRQDERG